jgi:hypothetical protein
VPATSGTQIVIVGFAALEPDEQDEAYAQITDLRLTRLAGVESETAQLLASLRRVAELTVGELSPGLYRRVRRELGTEGEEIAEFNALVRHFGSWRACKEALSLSEVTTPAKIDARFRSRLVGKVHRYREETLGETLQRCAHDLGHVPLVVEFEHWREREIELAKAQGRELFLPSDSPYRRRFGSWEAALLHFGFTPEAVAERLEPGLERSRDSLSCFRFTLSS